jgi:hypothetical protein
MSVINKPDDVFKLLQEHHLKIKQLKRKKGEKVILNLLFDRLKTDFIIKNSKKKELHCLIFPEGF